MKTGVKNQTFATKWVGNSFSELSVGGNLSTRLKLKSQAASDVYKRQPRPEQGPELENHHFSFVFLGAFGQKLDF